MNSNGRKASPTEKDNIHTSRLESTPVAKEEHSNLPKQPEPTGSAHNAPDGGRTAWLVILGNWCTSFCSFGWVNSMSVVRELS